MTTALIALLGVVIGSFLNYLLQRASDRRRFEREERNGCERAQHERDRDTEQPSPLSSPLRRITCPALWP